MRATDRPVLARYPGTKASARASRLSSSVPVRRTIVYCAVPPVAARTSSTPARSSRAPGPRTGTGPGTGAGGGVPPSPGTPQGDGAAPTIQVLCNAGPGIVSVLWWRRRARDAASAGDDAVSSLVPAPPVAVACASSGAIHFWDAVRGARLCSVTIPGRIERAELVDAGDTLGQKLLVSGETNGVDSPPIEGALDRRARTGRRVPSRRGWEPRLRPETHPRTFGNPARRRRREIRRRRRESRRRRREIRRCPPLARFRSRPPAIDRPGRARALRASRARPRTVAVP